MIPDKQLNLILCMWSEKCQKVQKNRANALPEIRIHPNEQFIIKWNVHDDGFYLQCCRLHLNVTRTRSVLLKHYVSVWTGYVLFCFLTEQEEFWILSNPCIWMRKSGIFPHPAFWNRPQKNHCFLIKSI